MPDFSSSPDFMNDSVPTMTPNPSLETLPTNLTPSTPSAPSKFKFSPKKTGIRFLVPLLLLAVVGVAVAAGMVLVSSSQDVRQQASGGPDYTCGSGFGLFSTQVPNSTPCLWDGAPYFRCSDGFHNENNGCLRDSTTGTPNPSTTTASFSTPSPGSTIALASTPSPNAGITSFSTPSPSVPPSTPGPVTTNQCASGLGLFSGAVANSHSCFYNGSNYYECNGGYVNASGGCVLLSNTTPCNSANGLMSSPIANTHSCVFNGLSYFECNGGFHAENSRCVANGAVPGTPAPATINTYQISGSSCLLCVPASSCAYTFEQCNAEIQRRATVKMCWSLSNNCSLGIERPACSVEEFESWNSCLYTLEALRASQNEALCWNTLDGCLIAVSRTGRTSCESGEFTSSDACYAALSTSSSEGSGSLAGSSVSGE